jgi:hypothetical protein
MKTTNCFLLTLVLTLVGILQAVQTTPVFVNLSVTRNEKTVHQPREMTLTFGHHTIRTPVRGGRFEVPQEIAVAAKAEDVSVLVVVGSDQLRFSAHAGVFQREIWSLKLADKHFDDATQSMIPASESPRSFCLLEFSDKHSEVSALLLPHCRAPIAK